VKICNRVIAALGRSAHEDAGDRVEALLDWMHSIGLSPDTMCYNSALGAFLHYRGVYQKHRIDNVERAILLFKRMKTDPTTVTFSLMVHICQSREDHVAELFENCVERGLLDDRLINNFREHGPPAVVLQLEGEIPSHWRKFADRGPDGPSRKTIEWRRKKAKPGKGRRVDEWGW
jgi:hypothetical protein